MSSFREGLLKWNLMLTTAPLVTVVLLARFLLERFYVTDGRHFSGVMDFGAIAPILTAGVFLASGYALLDTLVSAVLLLLVICSYKQDFCVVGKYVIIGFVSLTYVYIWRLIRDLDDPFEYGENEQRSGAAEIDLFPLLEFQERLKERKR